MQRRESGTADLLDRLAHPVVDFWLPPGATDLATSDVLRMRIVSAVLQALAGLALAFGLLDLTSGTVLLSLTLLLGVPLAFLTLYWMRRGASMQQVGVGSSATLYLVVIANASLNGGLEAPVFYFLPLVPSLALLMDARRLAGGWVVVCVATAVMAFVIEGPLGIPLDPALPIDKVALNRTLVIAAACVMVYAALLLHVSLGIWMQEQLLKAESERLDRVLDAAGDAILRVALDGRVSSANAAARRLFGLPRLRGVAVDELLPEVEGLQRAAGAVVLEAVGNDGPIPVEATHTLLNDGHVLVVRDVRERLRAREELEQARDDAEAANLAKSRFLASMSHELRTPLNAVIGYAEMVGEAIEDGEPPEDASDMTRIVGSARHLLALIDQVLDLAKVEAGRMEVEFRPVSLRAFCEELATVGRTLAAAGDNRWSSSLPGEDVAVHLDEIRLRQIALNLLSNAAKFCERGEIALEVTYAAERLVLTVSDTGIGMSPEELANVWEEFVQADRSTSRLYGGTGLGLPLARRLAHLLGGTLEARSVKGEGTTFTVELPVARVPDLDE